MGEISAFSERRGLPRPMNDTWIAACCLAEALPLATLNVKEFSDFAEHEGLTIVTAGLPIGGLGHLVNPTVITTDCYRRCWVRDEADAAARRRDRPVS